MQFSTKIDWFTILEFDIHPGSTAMTGWRRWRVSQPTFRGYNIPLFWMTVVSRYILGLFSIGWRMGIGHLKCVEYVGFTNWLVISFSFKSIPFFGTLGKLVSFNLNQRELWMINKTQVCITQLVDKNWLNGKHVSRMPGPNFWIIW